MMIYVLLNPIALISIYSILKPAKVKSCIEAKESAMTSPSSAD